MGILIFGLALWVVAHFTKRLAPNLRNNLNGKFGESAARGIIAITILISLILMIIGYRSAPFNSIYTPIQGMGHLNNLLMLGAVFLFGMSGSTGRIGTSMRHPMLTGVIVWGAAHLLVNGDAASLVLFGGMISWAIIQILIINRADGAWVRPEAGPIKKDILLFVITIVVFSVITGIHTALGRNPFLGTYG